MTHDEMIAVIQAHKAGKKIQCKDRRQLGAKWSSTCVPIWNFSDYDYQVAPEPRVIYVNEYMNKNVMHAYHTTREADENRLCGRVRVSKFIEVLDDPC